MRILRLYHLQPLKRVKIQGFAFQIGWKSIVIGYGFGLVFGAAIGHIVTATARNRNWFMKNFGMRRVVRGL